MNPTSLADLAAGKPVSSWLILGPFVVHTGGHFEREYLYERHRILDLDYLAAAGGEAKLVPEMGKVHENTGLGPKRLAWRPYEGARIRGMEIAGEIIYETVQRNCVIYAAAFIDSDRDTPALLDAYHSGMKAWVNGALVCNEPYGMPKGVRLTMPSKLIQLERGRNTLLIKFRPGYIADGVDFNVRDVTVSPLQAVKGHPLALGRIRPLPRFTGSLAEPRQVIEAAVVNMSDVTVTAKASLLSRTLNDKDRCDIECAPRCVTPLRMSLCTPRAKAGTQVRAQLRVGFNGEYIDAPFLYEAAPAPEHGGTELVLTAFHFDTTYHEEQRVYAMGAFDIVRQYCRLHRLDPNFRSTLSEVDYLKPYFDMFPEDRETLMRAFRENRSNSDVMYNQPNEQNCGGEALVRNFLYGQLFHGRVLGRICHVYGPGDVFGHPNQLSQIARKSGCTGVWWEKYIYNFPPFFQHLALDGSALPHMRGEVPSWPEVRAMGLSITTASADQTPPTDWHRRLLPEVRQGTFHDLMEEVTRADEADEAHLPITSRDMALYHAATAMSRINLKIANRLGENALLSAEKFATLAAWLGAKYPEKALDKAWRQILCGQHHDSITGTHNEISYVDLMASYREVLELARGALDRSLAYLGGLVNTGRDRAVIVFNPMAWTRADAVRATVPLRGGAGFELRGPDGAVVPFETRRVERDAKGKAVAAEILFVARDMPSLGYRAYAVTPSKVGIQASTPDKGLVIENEFYRIEADPLRGGGLARIYDKRARREILNTHDGHVGNELAILHEVPNRAEAQHEFYTTGLKFFSSERPASVEAVHGPLTSTLRARYRMGELCGVIQEVTLTKGVRRIDFRTVLDDYQGEDHLFCVTFPTSLQGAVPVFDERFGVVTRNDSKNYLDFRTHQMIMFSDCAVYAANKWMEHGGSAWLRLGRNCYALGMIGLITPKDNGTIRSAEAVQRVLVKRGVTCTPWYDEGGPHWGSYQASMDDDLLYTRFRLSIGVAGANVYSARLIARQKASVQRAYARRLERAGHAFLFVTDAQLGDPSWPALPVLVVEGKTQAELDAALEDMLGRFADTATILLPPNVDATGERHRVDDYGVAILNEGTYANSIEKGGVICMMLAHTCRWYGGTNNFPEGYLVPEQKHHVFRYALYPHAGTWRDADTQRAGHDFNHPLLATIKSGDGKGTLPREQAFLTVEPKNLVLEAMKPFGNPLPAFDKRAKCDPRKGIMLRLYDTEGVDTPAVLRFSGGIESAWAADMVEARGESLPVRDGAVSLYVGPNAIETVGFVPGAAPALGHAAALGAEAEPVQPVWVRSWEHDTESMPMGYETVVCSLSREVREAARGKRLLIRVNAVNDWTNAPARVTARLLLPKGWSANETSLTFALDPLGHATREVSVARPSKDAQGQVKLRYRYDGQTYQDVLEFGGGFDLQMAADNDGDRIVITVTNPANETVEGEVALVTPLEAWSTQAAADYALLEVTPRTQGFSLGGGKTKRLVFEARRTPLHALLAAPSYWAVAKLMSNGRIQLKRCDSRPPRRQRYAEVEHEVHLAEREKAIAALERRTHGKK